MKFWSLKIQGKTLLLVDFHDFFPKLVATFEGLKGSNGRDLNILISTSTCDEGDYCDTLQQYYAAIDLSYQGKPLIQDVVDQVPMLGDFRSFLLDLLIEQIKSYFPSSDLSVFKVFLPKEMPNDISAALTYGTIEINRLCDIFKMNDCLKLVGDWRKLSVSMTNSDNY